MKRKSFTRLLFPSYLVITLLSVVAVGWFATHSFRTFYLEDTSNELVIRAKLLRDRLSVLKASENIDRLARQLGEQTETRYTIIDRQGVVLGDTEEDPLRMENHANRQEVVQALKSDLGVSVRYSHTLNQEMMYVAVPIDSPLLTGVVRAAVPLIDIRQLLEGIVVKIVIAGLVIALLSVAIGWWISQSLTQPLREMRDVAEKFSNGELNHRISLSPNTEMGALAEAMNMMAKQLSERIETVASQKNEIEAILSSMTESLLAIDTDEKLIEINQAAMDLLGIQKNEALGKNIQEVVRNTELQEVARQSLKGIGHIEREIALHGQAEQYWQVHGTALINREGKNMGALLVLSDVTRIRRLERVRRDFVANVSHELKTPITSLKGFVETLQDGALDERENALRFLDIMAKQSDRLNAIIEDLLSLSRIEQEAEKGEIPLDEGRLLPVIQSAMELCKSRWTNKTVDTEVICSNDAKANINAPMLEQALVNLIDNAIKYSSDEGRVTIEVSQNAGETLISVTDRGNGIPQEHLPRLFERFYRVDKARSRSLGGTGLGLAIVKHITQAHHGSITVDSRVGVGSVFQIHLP